MDWMTVWNVVQLAIRYGPEIKGIIDEASSNHDITTKVKALSPVLAGAFETIGAQFFPKAVPALHLVGGLVAAFDPNVTKWLQAAINNLVSPSPHLIVDGIYGPKTRAAVEVVQAKLGLKVDGIAGMLTQAAITAALAK